MTGGERRTRNQTTAYRSFHSCTPSGDAQSFRTIWALQRCLKIGIDDFGGRVFICTYIHCFSVNFIPSLKWNEPN